MNIKLKTTKIGFTNQYQFLYTFEANLYSLYSLQKQIDIFT